MKKGRGELCTSEVRATAPRLPVVIMSGYFSRISPRTSSRAIGRRWRCSPSRSRPTRSSPARCGAAFITRGSGLQFLSSPPPLLPVPALMPGSAPGPALPRKCRPTRHQFRSDSAEKNLSSTPKPPFTCPTSAPGSTKVGVVSPVSPYLPLGSRAHSGNGGSFPITVHLGKEKIPGEKLVPLGQEPASAGT